MAILRLYHVGFTMYRLYSIGIDFIMYRLYSIGIDFTNTLQCTVFYLKMWGELTDSFILHRICRAEWVIWEFKNKDTGKKKSNPVKWIEENWLSNSGWMRVIQQYHAFLIGFRKGRRLAETLEAVLIFSSIAQSCPTLRPHGLLLI